MGCVAFFGACSAFMAYKATHNAGGLIIDGIITLGRTGATAFYWVIAALAAGFVLFALVLAVRRIAFPRILEVGADALSLPHGPWQRHITRIAYPDIQDLSEVEISGQRFLYVTVGGRRYTITASLFPDAHSYTAVRDFLFHKRAA